jgi:hypothetical protein
MCITKQQETMYPQFRSKVMFASFTADSSFSFASAGDHNECVQQFKDKKVSKQGSQQQQQRQQ